MHRWARRGMGARAEAPRQDVYESGDGEGQARFPWLVCLVADILFRTFLKLTYKIVFVSCEYSVNRYLCTYLSRQRCPQVNLWQWQEKEYRCI